MKNKKLRSAIHLFAFQVLTEEAMKQWRMSVDLEPSPIKVKKKTKIIVEKPTLPVVKDTIINVIDTLSN